MKTKYFHYIFLWILISVNYMSAQVTSSALNGKITDSKGEVLPGVAVLATHVPTGTKYSTLTDLNGVYHLVNLIPGGPYSIKATYVGQKDQLKEGVMISLGENARINITMQENTQELEQVDVVVGADDNKKGTGTRITKEQIQQLPTLSRSITDFTRLTPQVTNNSFAGSNFRYNNISLDGAVNNDAIGFSPSYGGQGGTSNMPGSSTRNNPISLDAIQDMAVSIAPYDVKVGNFTGGSVNAVTRRGTNNVEGSVYSFFRNATLTGPDNAGDKSKTPSSYQDYQTGLRVGVPIIKDKLFFFTNFELTNRTEPLFYNAGDPGTFMTTAIAQQIADSLKSATYMPTSQYNKGTYDPGTYGAYNIMSKSIKFFARVDWNINSKNQLSLRNNYVPSSSTNLERDATTFQFGNYDFTQNNLNNSTVMELKSQINNKMANNFIAGYTNIHDYRTPAGQIFPQMQINNVNGSGVVFIGSNREASIFNQRSQTYEITDNFNWFLGKHSITLGTHNEVYNIDYGFVNSWNGRIDYNSLSDFINKKPARERAIYNMNNNDRDYNNNNPVAKFSVMLMSAYAQDEYAVKENLKVTLGVRMDYNAVSSPPARTPSVAATDPGSNYGTSFNYTPFNSLGTKVLGQPVVSPRLGFTYDIANNKKYIIRGGSGVFSGRIPFAWFGYAYYNNGVNYGAFDYKNAPAGSNIATDPTQFQAYNTNVLKQPNRVEVDLIDNNFKMPRVWRSNLATDLMLPGGVKLTLEGIYTKTMYDVMFKQINLKDSVKYAPIDVNHEQPIYLSGGPTSNRVNNAFSSAYLMTNTTQGYRYQLTAQLSKEFKFGLNVMAAYTYGQARDIANGIRNSFESNWQVNQALVANNPQLAYSNFDIRHRIISTAGYKKSWNKKLTSYLSFVFSGQSGSPYTWVLNSNKITNSGQQVDLAYVPRDQSEINLVQYTVTTNGVTQTVTPQQQWDALDAYISGDKYLNSRRGHFTERNAARTPWNNRLDMRLMQDINFYTKNERKHTLQITLDIINVTNLINPKWGYAYFVNNTINQSVSFGLTPLGSFGANGNPNYNYTTPTTTPYSIDKLNSRWQGQIGLRYLF